MGTVSDGWEGLDGRELAHSKRELSDNFNLMATLIWRLVGKMPVGAVNCEG